MKEKNSTDRRNQQPKKKAGKSDTASAQPELFEEDLSPAAADDSAEKFPEEFRGSMLSSSRATRLLARQAAEEAMDFTGTGTKKSSPKKPQEKTKAVRPKTKKPSTRKAARKKGTARARKRRQELIKFITISGSLLILAAVLITIIILQDSSRFTQSVETPEGPVPYIDEDTPFSGEVRLYIRPGMKAADVCRLLDSAGVVSSAAKLQRVLMTDGLDTRIRSGPIFLPIGMDVEDAATALVRGYWEHPIIGIYDGYTIAQIDQMIYGLSLADRGEFTDAAGQVANTNGLPFSEGYFYPDEYILQGTDHAALTLARQMHERFQLITSDLADELRLQGRTLEQAVIVASMIQRETANSAEMPLIAGIIWKRLDEGIPLGIDATTRYEINDWTNPLTKAVLDAQTPYNTRRKRGLPPTGISNPGFDALQAAVFPQESPYYFYLHDENAQIHFAVTYEQHLENVSLYLN